jgi:hypothetical protein
MILALIATSTALMVSAATAAVGGVVGAVGAIKQGKAAKKMAAYNAQLAANNAKIQQNNAKTVQNQASVEAEKQRRTGRIVAGKQRAKASKSGTTFEGSVQDILLDSSINAEIGALTELYSGNIAAQDYRNKAASSNAQGTMAIMQGKAASTASKYQAAGSILGGFSSAVSSYGMSKSPQFGP